MRSVLSRSRTSLWRSAVACLAAAALLLPTVAHASPFSVPTIVGPADTGSADTSTDPDAESTEEEARDAYREGSNAYALGNYADAVVYFERAYELSQRAELLFNLGQAYTRWYDISNDVEHLKKARRLYENYVINVDSTSMTEAQKADARADAQKRITEVDRRIAKHEGVGTSSRDRDQGPRKPVYKKAWFWIAIIGGAAAVAGVTTAVVLTTRRNDGFQPELGTIGDRAGLGPGLSLRF